jgi:hypothetical protein
MALKRPNGTPAKGTHCRYSPRCQRPATRYGWIAKLSKRPGPKHFTHERWPFCEIHARQNAFGLWAFHCLSTNCLRRRFVASGGWLDVKGRPEDIYIYVPNAGILDNEADAPKGTVLPVNSLLKCPWCGTRLKPVR